MDTQINDKLLEIAEKLDKIEKLCYLGIPPSRRTKRAMESEPLTAKQLAEARDEDFLLVFERLAQMTRGQKLAHGFHTGIVQGLGQTPWEIVPVSILRNRLTQRKIFAPDVDAGEKSFRDVIDALISRTVRRGILREQAIREVLVNKGSLSKTRVLLTGGAWTDFCHRVSIALREDFSEPDLSDVEDSFEPELEDMEDEPETEGWRLKV